MSKVINWTQYFMGDDCSHGQFLHAKKLGFIHPTTKEYMEFESELPDYFKAKLDELEEEMKDE